MGGEAAAPRVGDPTRSRNPKTTSPCIGRKKGGTRAPPCDQLISALKKGDLSCVECQLALHSRQVRCQLRQSFFQLRAISVRHLGAN